ncbi:MAG TPA: GNAT family N-acetyltransferase [Candidatus Saccharimonadales bacterium]|nr:GNAT family N-acetyltransferase [Candidatus Saccharimonadales bacterium]
MSTETRNEVTIRRATPGDSAVCGDICYRAFASISSAHNFRCDFPNAATAAGVISSLFSHPGFYCVVAESGGRIVGSNALDERSIVAGIGPATVDPDAQNLGAGRKLMQAVMDRANESRPAGMRLVQAAYHSRSLSLYASLGFDVREPLSCVQGSPRERSIPGCSVRPAQTADVEACNTLARRVHGLDRGVELAEAMEHKTAFVVERGGRLSGYATALAFSGHAVAETNEDLQALISSAESFGGPGILVPSRNTELLRWCLKNGLRVTQTLTLMTIGLYNEPAGAWLPSILF